MSLFEAAAAGDEVAFAGIVNAHDNEMYRVCVAVCRDQTIAADAVQAAWAIAWRKLGSVREPERLRPWLIAIAVNEARTLLKKRQKRSQVEVATDATGRPGGLDPATGIATVDLRTALEHLDPDDRALLAMRYVAGFNASELATAIGLSPPGTEARPSSPGSPTPGNFAALAAVRVRDGEASALTEAVIPLMMRRIEEPDVKSVTVAGKRLDRVTDKAWAGKYPRYTYASGDTVWVIDAEGRALREIVAALP